MSEKTFKEIQASLTEKINAIKDPETGYNFNVDPIDSTDIIGVLINDVSLQLTEKTEQLIRLRNSLNPFKATGKELRDVIAYRGLTAKTGTRTTTKVLFIGDPGTEIPIGTQITNNNSDKIFITSKYVLINEDNYGDVEAYCDKAGEISLEEKELTRLVNPIPGVTVTGNKDIVIGSNDETDNEIHLRLRKSTGATGLGFLDTLDSSLMNLDGVKSAITYVGTDEDKELSAGEICSVVYGGDDTEIAETIFEKNIFLYKYKTYPGNTNSITIIIRSSYLDRPYQISFLRPEQYNLECKIDIAPLSTGLPDNIDEELYRNAKIFLESYTPSSVIYVSDMITFLNNLNICKVFNAALNKKDEETEEINKILVIPWNGVPVLSKADMIINKIT